MKTLKKNNISQGSSINSPVTVNKNCDLPPFFNSDYFGHVVVQTLEELESIPCKLRQDGMIATVVQDDYSDYQLQTSRTGFGICDNNAWVKISIGDEVFNVGNLFLFQTEEQANEFMGSTQSKEGQIIYISDLDSYFKFDGQDGLTDAFPNKLDIPTVQGLDNPNYKIPAYLDGKPYWRSSSDFEKVKSVNGKEGDVILKTSDLENNSDYTTNAILTAHTSNKANPHNVTKSQIGLGDVDNTSDLNKPISTATQIELNKKINKTTTNNTPDYVLLADGSTAPKTEFGKVDKVMGVAPDASKNVDISGVAINWTNASQRMSALVSKHNDETYNRLLGMDANGKLNEVGLPAMTNEMSKATDAQKDAWRLAQLKTGETYSTGQPRVDLILPIVLIGEDSTLVKVNGLNLFLNNTDYSAKVEIIDVLSGQVVETITNIQVNQSSPTTIYFNINRSLYEEYNHYTIRVTHNGIVSLVNNSVYFQIVNELINEPINMGWDIKTERLEGSTKSYSVTLNANNISIHSGGKNSLGQDESKPIIGFSDFYFTYDDSIMISYQYTGKAPASNGVVEYSSFFGIIPEEDIPFTALDLMTVENNYILKGGYSQFRGPVEYKDSTNAGIFGTNSNTEGTVNFTLYIQKGKIFIQFGVRIVQMNLPISSSGRYHLYFNNKGDTSTGSRTYSLNLLNSYKYK